MSAKVSIIGMLLLLCFCGCKSVKGQHARQQGSAAKVAAAKPMSCNMEGRVVAILKVYDADTGSVCAKHSCRARVQITAVPGCGASVSLALNVGDTVDMKFAYTLDNTERIFPAMKTKYPGLKKGDRFSATVSQRLKPGTDGEWVVYDYQRK